MTSGEDPHLSDDDRLALPALKTHGIDVSIFIWEETELKDFSKVDAIIFRSCWNYSPSR